MPSTHPPPFRKGLSEMNVSGWFFEEGFCYLDLMIEFQTQWRAMDEPFAVVGLAVSAPNPGSGEILEFAALLVDPKGTITAEFSAMVDVRQPVLDFVLREASIGMDHLRRPIAEAMKAFQDFIGSRPVFAHDAELVRPFLIAAGAEIESAFTNPLHDTLTMALFTWPETGSHRIQDLATLIGTPQAGERPIDDAKAVLEVIKAARREALLQDDQRLESRVAGDPQSDL